MMKFTTIAALVLILSIAAPAQTDPISVETDLVVMNVSVTDKNGGFVKGLTKDDFAVTDNGAKQNIDMFSASDSALSIGIVYDMHDADGQAINVLESLKRFTGRLGSDDDYFVMIFNEKGSLKADFVPDIDQVRRHLADPDKGTPASLYDAIIAAGDHTRKLRHAKKYLIVFSDGADRDSRHSQKELKQRLRSINLPLYSLTFRPDDIRQVSYVDIGRNGPRQAFRVGEASELDRNVVAELSRSTGGGAYESDIRNRVYLSALAAKFLDEARNQYVIGFSPESSDGRWHKLKVSVNGDRGKPIKAQSRAGYQSPKKAD
jgi:VWFA-related protein